MRYTSVSEYRDSTPTCTGDLEDVMGDILPDDAKITISDDETEYCVGHYDGNQTWMPLV